MKHGKFAKIWDLFRSLYCFEKNGAKIYLKTNLNKKKTHIFMLCYDFPLIYLAVWIRCVLAWLEWKPAATWPFTGSVWHIWYIVLVLSWSRPLKVLVLSRSRYSLVSVMSWSQLAQSWLQHYHAHFHMTTDCHHIPLNTVAPMLVFWFWSCVVLRANSLHSVPELLFL